MKGKITSVMAMFDDTTMQRVWQIAIDFDEEPPFKLGDVEVKQNNET